MAVDGRDRDSLSPTCTLEFFECFSPRKAQHVPDDSSLRPGVEREMKVMYQQPHLVPPMKLTVWDELPPTPPSSSTHFSQLMLQSRSIASKAHERASSTLSFRRRAPVKPTISSPLMASEGPNRRRRSFRPLELSIYLPDNRLSDLPAFDRLSFTDLGEIKFPPRAVIRVRSEEIMPTPGAETILPPKPASMFETRHRIRPSRASSVISSRPSSSYEALHSHPVSWVSIPGLPPQIDMVSRPSNSVDILTPMREEFTPPASARVIDNLVNDFPQIEDNKVVARDSMVPDEAPSAPSPKIPAIPEPVLQPPGPISSESQHDAYTATATTQTHRRISAWLATRPSGPVHSRSFSSSVSTVATVKTTSTSSSFADHRRKRSQFYMLSASPPQPPPQPLWVTKQLQLQDTQPQHSRNATVSTVASTVDTEVLSFDDEYIDEAESTTTAPTASEVDSRSGTIKSVATRPSVSMLRDGGNALRPIISGVPDLPVEVEKALVTPRGRNDKMLMEGLITVKEINGPLRSPIGVAF